MAHAEEVCHGDVASLIALVSMVKIKYMDSPEIYRTLMAFLTDYDPSHSVNRERTLRYIRLLITDEALANCIVMSLPEGGDSNLDPKAVVAETTRNLTEARPTSLHSPRRCSPAIITCDRGPTVSKIKNSGTVKSTKQANSLAGTCINRKVSNPRIPTAPITGTLSQGQAVKGQFPITNGTGQVFASPVGMMLPFQYGDYRFPLQCSQFHGLQSNMALGNLFPWQYTNFMSAWAQSAASEGGLDLSLPNQPVDLTGKKPQKQSVRQSHTTRQHKLKRSVSSTATAAAQDKDGSTKPKLQKMNSDSVLHRPAGVNKDFKDVSATPGRLDCSSTSPKSPIGSLQDLVSAIASCENLQSSDNAKDEKVRGSIMAKDLKESGLRCMENLDNFQVSEQIKPASIPSKANPVTDNKCGNAVKNEETVCSISDNASRAFPYSQKIHLPNGKYSVVNLHGENKISNSLSQVTVSQNLPVQQLTWSKGVQGPGSRRSCSLSDLLKLTPGDSSNFCSEGVSELSSVVTETSKSLNSTTVKIKLNTCNSEKLLGQILKLQQAKGCNSVQASPLTSSPNHEGIMAATCPGDEKIYASKSGQNFGTSRLAEENKLKDKKVKPQTARSAAVQVFNTRTLGQAFAIQAKPDFTANRISVTDKAFIHTIKQRLQSRNKQHRANSDSVLLTSSRPLVLAQVSEQVGNGDGSKVNSQVSLNCEGITERGSKLKDIPSPNSALSSRQSSPYLQENSQIQDSCSEEDEVFTENIVIAK